VTENIPASAGNVGWKHAGIPGLGGKLIELIGLSFVEGEKHFSIV